MKLEEELFEFLKHGDEEHQRWLHEAIHAYFDNKPRPEPRQVLDLEKTFFAELAEAANESNWIPKQYFVNDWVADCVSFLKTGEGLRDADTVEFLALLRHWLKRDMGTFRQDNTIRQILNLAEELRQKIENSGKTS